MQWTAKGMVRCDEQLDAWVADGFDAHMVLQVHDELVFDMPKRAHPLEDKKRSNLGRIKTLRSLMELGGNDIGLPTPVAIEFNEVSWDKGVRI